MKKFLKVIVAVLIISLIGFIAAFVFSGFNGDYFPDIFYASADDDFSEVSQTTDIDGLTDIYIKGQSERIRLSNSDSDELILKYFVSEYKSTTYTNEGGKISVVSEYKKRNWLSGFKIQTGKTDYIEIKLPAGYDGIINLDTTSGAVEVDATNTFASVRLRSTSNRIKASGIKSAGGVDIQTTSDNVDLNGCDFSAAAAVKTTSGEIRINDCRFADTTIKTNSDDIRINRSAFNNLTINNNSGEINLNSVTANNITATTSSDNINLNSVTAADINAQTASGSIEAADSVFGTAYFKTSSDKINLDIDCDNVTAISSSGSLTVRVKGSFEEYKMDVKTSSGNITVDGTKYYSQIINPNASKYIYAHTSSANVKIYFD